MEQIQFTTLIDIKNEEKKTIKTENHKINSNKRYTMASNGMSYVGIL